MSSPDDVKALAPAVLRHRVILSAAAEIEGRPVESVIAAADRGDRGAALIYPTRRTILIAAAIGPAALIVGLLAPAYWTGGLALLVLLLALCGVDALTGAGLRQVEVACEGPRAVSVGETFATVVRARFRSRPPRRAEFALGVSGPVAAPFGLRAQGEMSLDGGSAAVPLTTERRGTARLENIWIRWTGPLGLIWKQRQLALGQAILITPDIRAVSDKGVQMMNQEAMFGIKAQLQVGEGAEFEALADYRPGMDRRAIDWKTSARHTMLIAKEYRTERNNNIVMALDAGRAMSEPIGAVPRVDRAVSAALLTAFVALKDGDRVGFFAFDSRPRASSKPIGGERAFATLQRVAAGIDYSANETNYTLGIATLASELSRRSLIIIFTEFADTISAELMLGAVGTLLKRHLVLFVVLQRRGARNPGRRRADGARRRQPRGDRRRLAARAPAGDHPAAPSRRPRHRGAGGRGRAGGGQRLSRFQAPEPDLMAAPADSRRFRAAREGEWRRLEDILNIAEKKSVRSLEDEDLLALPILYRGALSSLSVARETSLDLELITYLEGLCARAYFFVYGVRTSAGSRLAAFFARDWPAAVRGLWRETLVSFTITLIGVLAGYLLVSGDPGWYGSLVPAEMADGRDFDATAEYLRGTLYHDEGGRGLSAFATFLFTHNSQIAIMCFALGFAFGVPTAMLLIQNGAMAGAILALFATRGLGMQMGGWLIIHGSTEFFAIILAGAAGFRIGWSVVFPGEESRLDAATVAGRSAAIVMAGVVIMLLCAGLLEGLGRQLVTGDAPRYAIGIAMLVLWCAYFYLPRRAR